MPRSVVFVALLGAVALLASPASAAPVAAQSTGTATIGDGGRDGEEGAGLIDMGGQSWGGRSDVFCGEVGNAADGERLGTEFLFPLGALPDGAVITQATLAVHDANPSDVAPIMLIGFAGSDPMVGIKAAHPAGGMSILPTTSSDREAYDVTGIIPDDAVALGWMAFWMEPTDDTAWVHRLDCPRDPVFPVLTVRYAVESRPQPVPGTLTLAVGESSAYELRRTGDQGWAGLTSWICGNVGRDVAGDVEGRLVMQFSLERLPAGARITHGTLALHDGAPDPAGPIEVVGFVTDGLAGSGLAKMSEPREPTGAVTIDPATAAGRESWDVGELVDGRMVAAGWAAFMLRAADDTDGMHQIACPGESSYPILTVAFVAPEPSADGGSVATLPPTSTDERLSRAPASGTGATPFAVLVAAAGVLLSVVRITGRRSSRRR